MRAVRIFGEAIAGGDPAPIRTEESFARLAQESVVLVLGEPSNNAAG
jgi:hypothetical protein